MEIPKGYAVDIGAQHGKSPLRWAGSKRKLLPVLETFWRPTDKKYIEAFAGSACLFFHLQPVEAVLNDANSDLISAYQVLAGQPHLLHNTLLDMAQDPDTYYRLRKSQPTSDAFESAVRFFYLNRFCFNGIYRTNKAGQFNVPYASYKTGGFPKLADWLAASKALRTAKLASTDFEEVVREHVATGDFVYMDPPYAVKNRRVFAQYSANEFGVDDLRRMQSVMKHIDAIGATFVVSYALSQETEILSEGWHSLRKLAQRNVAGFSHHRRKAVEVLITNDPSRIRNRGQNVSVA